MEVKKLKSQYVMIYNFEKINKLISPLVHQKMPIKITRLEKISQSFLKFKNPDFWSGFTYSDPDMSR